MLELVVGRDSPSAPRTTPWFDRRLRSRSWCSRSSRAGASRSPLRRRTGCSPRRSRSSTASSSRSSSSVFVVGMAAAFLLGNLRDAAEGAGRPGRRARRRGDRRLQHPRPHGQPSSSSSRSCSWIGWLAGFALRERAEQAEAAEVRAAPGRARARGGRTRRRAEERARIARELHDIVAHAVSVMVLQVGAVRHKLPEALAEDRDALRASSRRAARRSPRCAASSAPCAATGTTLELAPQPGLDGLDSLAREVGRAGLPVELHVDGEPFPLPRDRPLRLSDRPGRPDERAQARARQRRGRDRPLPAGRAARSRCATTATGASTSDGLGHGLVGVRERVKIYGGEMTAGTAPEGGFVLSTRLPLGGDGRMTIRVLVADDQSMVRAGFRMLLAGESGHRGRRRGEQRARGGRQGRALRPDRRPDGHPHARARRARGDAAHPRGRRRARGS